MSKNKKLALILCSAIVVMILIITFIGKALGTVATDLKAELEGGVAVQELTVKDLSSAIYASGTVASQNKVSITTELTGQVKELYVQLGDYVEAGTPLLVMDDTEIREKIAELEKQLSEQEVLTAKQKEINQRNLDYAKEEQTQMLSEAKKAVDSAKNESAQAAVALENAKNAYNSYVTSGMSEEGMMLELKAAMEQAQVAYDTAKAALSEAESTYNATVRSTNQQVQAAQDTIDTQDVGTDIDNTASTTLAELYSQLEKVTITAPQSGIITSLNISTGSMVTTGDLMVIEDNKNLKLTVSIPEMDILKLSEGMHAIIKADALEDVEMKGTVNKVINFSTTSGDNSMAAMEGMSQMGSYSAEIVIEGDTQLLLGMNAKAEIVLTEKKDALSVAYDSIFTEDEDKHFVYQAVETKDSTEDNTSYKVKKVPVTIGDEGDYYTEIISDELKEGDLIVSYPDLVAEGDIIQADIEAIAE